MVTSLANSMFGALLNAGQTKSGVPIRLIPPDESFLPVLVGWLNDPAVMDLLNPTWQPTDVHKEQQQFERFSQDAGIMWMIQAGEQFVGLAWINNLERSADQPEFGILIGPEYAGQGIATAVERTVTEWALTSGGYPALKVAIFAGNDASKHIAEKVGYALVPDSIEWDGKLLPGYSGIMTREAWQALH